jgi:hypothetical protein
VKQNLNQNAHGNAYNDSLSDIDLKLESECMAMERSDISFNAHGNAMKQHNDKLSDISLKSEEKLT